MRESVPWRLLVVDDEVTHLRALCETLQAYGVQASGCEDAAAALALLQRERFDLLLTDLNLGGMDGIELLGAAMKIDPHLVGVVMTGAGTVEAAVAAMRSGAVDFIIKPLKMRTAMPVIERAMELRRLRVENALLQERVQAQMAELESANRELEAFSYSVSHDLRSPLHVIGGFSSVLEKHAGQLDDTGRHYLARIRQAVGRMDALVTGLLDLAHVGRRPISRERVDMHALAANVAEELVAGGRAARGTIEVNAALPEAQGDAVLLRQVFANLLSNACKFSAHAKPPRVFVGASATPRGPIYFVQDNGAGFDSAQAARLFQPFQRFHTESEFQGIGIGLSLVRRIVERHGGRVWAESTPGAGATFRFELG